MNDVVASTLQKARAEFARSTTTLARQTMMQVRQLDRVREIDSRFYVMFEVACLFRDNSTAEATNTLRGIMPLSDAEWAELQTILGSAPENKFPAFASACRGLRNQFTPPIILKSVSPTQSDMESALRKVNEVKDSTANYKSSPEGRRQLAKASALHLLYGLIWICAGIGATWLLNKTATAGDYHWTFWGVSLIGYGVVDFFYGLFRWIKYSN